MVLLTRAAPKLQAANDGGSQNNQQATVRSAFREGNAGNSRNDHESGGARPVFNEDAIGGVGETEASAKATDSRTDETSQTNILHRKGNTKQSRRPVKQHRTAQRSTKKADRKTNTPNATEATSTNGGSDAHNSENRKALPRRKRKQEEVDDPTVGTLEGGISQTNRRFVRRKVGENVRILRNATNASAVSANALLPPGVPEENDTEADDGDHSPRFTREQKGKFTEREGDAADGLMELSVPRFFSEDEGVEEPTTAEAAFDGPSEEEEEDEDDSVGELSLDEFLSLFEPPTECRFKESDMRTALTEED